MGRRILWFCHLRGGRAKLWRREEGWSRCPAPPAMDSSRSGRRVSPASEEGGVGGGSEGAEEKDIKEKEVLRRGYAVLLLRMAIYVR